MDFILNQYFINIKETWWIKLDQGKSWLIEVRDKRNRYSN